MMRHRISGSDAAEDDDIPQCARCGGLTSDPCDTDEKQKRCELPDFCFPASLHGESFNAGVNAANEMIGALWSDLFNKDLVKAEGADYFDRWRGRLKELKTPEPNVTSRERKLFDALERISIVCHDNGATTRPEMVLKFVGGVSRLALSLGRDTNGNITPANSFSPNPQR